VDRGIFLEKGREGGGVGLFEREAGIIPPEKGVAVW